MEVPDPGGDEVPKNINNNRKIWLKPSIHKDDSNISSLFRDKMGSKDAKFTLNQSDTDESSIESECHKYTPFIQFQDVQKDCLSSSGSLQYDSDVYSVCSEGCPEILNDYDYPGVLRRSKSMSEVDRIAELVNLEMGLCGGSDTDGDNISQLSKSDAYDFWDDLSVTSEDNHIYYYEKYVARLQNSPIETELEGRKTKSLLDAHYLQLKIKNNPVGLPALNQKPLQTGLGQCKRADFKNGLSDTAERLSLTHLTSDKNCCDKMSSYLEPIKQSSNTVKKGTLILSCKPFAYTLVKNYTEDHCDTCFRKGVQTKTNDAEHIDTNHLSRCSGCHLIWYCNRDCQKKGWRDGHRWECLGFKKFGQLPASYSRLLLRVLVKLQSKSDVFDRISSNKSRRFDNLMSHYIEVRGDSMRMDHIYTSAKVVESLLSLHGIGLPGENELIGICGKIYVNTFSITDPELHKIGSGLYLGASIFDHSCAPIACATFQSTTIYIRNIVEYPESLPVEKVTISYQDTLRPSTYRIPELRSIYYFDCACELCSDSATDASMKAIECQHNHGQIELTNGRGSCVACGYGIDVEKSLKIREAEEMCILKLKEMEDIGYLDVCETTLRVMKSLGFADTHWLVTNMASQAFDSSIEMNRWDKAFDYGNMAVKGFRKYLSTHHPFLGIMLLKMAKLSWYIEKAEQAKAFIQEGKEIIDITHGPNCVFSLTEVLPMFKEITGRPN